MTLNSLRVETHLAGCAKQRCVDHRFVVQQRTHSGDVQMRWLVDSEAGLAAALVLCQERMTDVLGSLVLDDLNFRLWQVFVYGLCNWSIGLAEQQPCAQNLEAVTPASAVDSREGMRHLI